MPIRFPRFRPRRESYPPDLWTKCPSCEEMLFNRQLERAARVCPHCGYHFRLGARARVNQLVDPGSWEEEDAELVSVDPLGFVDQKPYPDRLLAAQTATGLREAAIWGRARIEGHRIVLVVMDFGFMGGSMGAVVGEKVARAAEAATRERLPLIIVSASGGARMQEGTLALMQLAKTVAALERLRAAGIPYLSVMTDPTTGGVFASFASLGDVNLAEPNALIGFAGARVSAGTIGQDLPPGFQRAEFLLEHGFVDRIVPRSALRGELAALLRLLVPRGAPVEVPAPPVPLRPLAILGSLAERAGAAVGLPLDGDQGERPGRGRGEGGAGAVRMGAGTPGMSSPATIAAAGPGAPEVAGRGGLGGALPGAGESPTGTVAGLLSPTTPEAVWARVQAARNLRRPRTLELLRHMADEVVELHGDRLYGEDPAMVAAVARIAGRRLVVVGQQKGADTEENIRRNFGMPHPEGYRKAMRAMELAERLAIPVLSLVDVPGAHPGPESEERGIAEAIARSIGLMSRLRVPTVAVITGEGGSGGALAIAVADVVLALENAVYSVISPEGCASILWRSPDQAALAAAAMRMTAADQLALGVVDEVIPEPGEGAHTDHAETARRIKAAVLAHLDRLSAIPIDELLEARYRRYRSLGPYAVALRPRPAAERPGLTDRLRTLIDVGRQTLPIPPLLAGRDEEREDRQGREEDH